MNGFFTEQSLISTALAGAYALQCTATPAPDRPAGAETKLGPVSLHERVLELTACSVVRGVASPAAKATLTGYTQLAAVQRADDPRDATLTFDAQRLFDRPWPATFSVLVIVGGPPVVQPMGANHRGAVLTGSSAPVRAFALLGADANLGTEARKLTGWQAKATADTTLAAIRSGHPLLALDALRIAVRDAALDPLVLAGTELLHPSHPSAVRAAAIELLVTALANAKPGSAEAERLVEVVLVGWELEQRDRVELAYLRSLLKVSPQLRAAKLHERARAAGDAPNASELAAALKDLAAALK